MLSHRCEESMQLGEVSCRVGLSLLSEGCCVTLVWLGACSMLAQASEQCLRWLHHFCNMRLLETLNVDLLIRCSILLFIFPYNRFRKLDLMWCLYCHSTIFMSLPFWKFMGIYYSWCTFINLSAKPTMYNYKFLKVNWISTILYFYFLNVVY